MRLLRCVMCYAAILLTVINTSHAQDSLGMRHVSTLDYWYRVDDIKMVGDIAYVSTNISGLYVMDLSDTFNPVEICHIPSYRSAFYYKGIDIVGNRLYVCSQLGVSIFDISDPANPIL